MSNKLKTKKGAASFYIVAFSTLILVIIAASFATAVINEIMRSSNDDLSQSAYDSALAGVEDAKIAYLNYLRCKEADDTGFSEPNGDNQQTCKEIVYWVEKNPNCFMVGHILGRIGEKEEKEVLISGTSKNTGNKTNNLNQAYTCATIQTELKDYVSTLTSENRSKVVKVKLGVPAKDIKEVVLKWYPQTEQTNEFYFPNIIENPSLQSGGRDYGWRVGFMPINTSKSATPPIISIDMIQTAENFNLDDFTKISRKASDGTINKTNRSSFVLVPAGTDEAAKDRANVKKYGFDDRDQTNDNYVDSSYQWWGAYDPDLETNYFPSRWALDSNSAGGGRGGLNPAYLVYCSDKTEYACEATFNLPGPYDEAHLNNSEDFRIERNDDTFTFIVSIPYGQPDTEFALEFRCFKEWDCGNQETIINPDGTETISESRTATISGMQVNIDSTGRANNLFRRVETRLDLTDTTYLYPLYAVELLKSDGETGGLLKKTTTPIQETHMYDGAYEAYLNERASTYR